MATNSGSNRSKPQKGENVDQIFQELLSHNIAEAKNTPPKKGLDDAVHAIYQQAHNHRDQLIRFYILYTVVFSLFVAALVIFQVQVRLIPGQEKTEIVPQWVLYLLVVGMFGQFISLLTIVTKKVWTFEPFLKHHTDTKSK